MNTEGRSTRPDATPPSPRPGRARRAAVLAVTALAAGALVGPTASADAQETGARGVQLEAAGLGTTLVGGAFPHDEMGFGGTVGVHYRWPSGLSLGVLGLYAEPEDLDRPADDPLRTMGMGGAAAELRYRLAPQASVTPFVGVRAGWTGLEDESDPDTFFGNGVGYGLVAGTELWASDRVAFRLSATGGGFTISDYFGGDGSTDALTWSAEAGLSVVLGSVSRDLDPDGDGVPEPRDRFPDPGDERLVAVGMGETQPVADNGTEAGRAENRRVEFVVVERRNRGEGDR